MEQWLEEIDLLEEEFRRLIRTCEKMHDIWDSLSTSVAPIFYPEWEGQRRLFPHSASQAPPPSYCAYALQKSAMYRQMAARAQTRFGKSGGTSLKEGESLSEHVRRRRPKTTVEWSKIQVDDVSTV